MDKMITELAIKMWVEEDKKLSNLLVEIQEMPLNIDEQADLAFQKISELYQLPKNPDDIIYIDVENDFEDTSVYEQLGLIKYLNSENDSRGNVLTAIYLVKNGYVVDKESIINKFKKTSNDQIVGFGFKGENSKVELVFIKKGQSWFDMGCKLFTKYE